METAESLRGHTRGKERREKQAHVCYQKANRNSEIGLATVDLVCVPIQVLKKTHTQR